MLLICGKQCYMPFLRSLIKGENGDIVKGKQIMKKDMYIYQQHGVIYQNYLWGFNAEKNELLKTDLETGEIDYVTSFDNMKFEETLFDYIVEYKGKLILLPGNSDYIVTYQIDTGKMEYYEYKESFSEYVLYQSFWKFAAPVIYSKWLYVFSAKNRYVMKIDLDTMDITYDIKPFISFSDIDEVILGNSRCIENNVTYVPCMNKNLCLQYDMGTSDFKWINITLPERKHDGFQYMNILKNYYVLLSNENEVIFLNKEMCQVEKIVHTKGEYGRIATYDDSILLVPFYRNNFVLMDNFGNIKELAYYGDMKFNPFFAEYVPTHTRIIQLENKCYIVPRCSNMFIWYEFGNDKLEMRKMGITDKYSEHLFQQLNDMNVDILIENRREGTLENLLRLLRVNEYDITPEVNRRNIGRVIYEQI